MKSRRGLSGVVGKTHVNDQILEIFVKKHSDDPCWSKNKIRLMSDLPGRLEHCLKRREGETLFGTDEQSERRRKKNEREKERERERKRGKG